MLILDVPPTTLSFDPNDRYQHDTPEERKRASELLTTYVLRHPRPTVYQDRVIDGVLFVAAAILLDIPSIEVIQVYADPADKPKPFNGGIEPH